MAQVVLSGSEWGREEAMLDLHVEKIGDLAGQNRAQRSRVPIT